MTDAADPDEASRRPTSKSSSAFRTISEVAEELEVPQHVLRFWETKFLQIRPLKRGGGRRYYRPEDVELLRRISQLLYREGYTIKGVQRLLREGQLRSGRPNTADVPLPLDLEDPEDEPPESIDPPRPRRAPAVQNRENVRELFAEILQELEEIRQLLAPP